MEVKQKTMEVKRRGKRGKKMSGPRSEKDRAGGPTVERSWGENPSFSMRKEDRGRALQRAVS